MSYDTQQYPHSDLTQKIIGAAMLVHRTLGPGLDEKIYENALCLEFAAQSLDFTQQQQFPVFYRNQRRPHRSNPELPQRHRTASRPHSQFQNRRNHLQTDRQHLST
ncbi:MAG: GxxExxY protein [Luteolibacter sp.]